MRDNFNSGLVFKKSNIRIWIHHRDLGNLQNVVWEGHGSKLLVEHSTNPKVKKFLEAVPHIMGLIKDIHVDVQNDDLASLMTHSSSPIPPVVLSGKDSNGLSPLHKAAGLGRHDIAKYIVENYADSVNSVDNDGRTPLHFSTLAKDNGQMFDFLIESGADESLLDNKQKTAAYYKGRNSEIDSKLLHVVPECPRTAKDGFASTFDWGTLCGSEIIAKPVKKIKELLEESTESKPEEENEEKQNTEVPENDAKDEVLENGVADEPEPEPEPKPEPVIELEPEADRTPEPEPKPEPEPEIMDNHTVVETEPVVSEIIVEDDMVPNGQVEILDDPEIQETTIIVTDDVDFNDIADAELIREDSVTPTNELENIVDHTHEENVKEQNVEKHIEQNHAELLKNVDEGEGVIEGVVNGENEIESVNEQGQGGEDKEDDPEILALIEDGNMEQLAALVLNGDGEKLVGYRSENPELQAFLDNVSTYMSKINRIHVAARDGSLRDLQAALDRRKFAIAKDHISPNGTSPLHVATIFGNTSIVRYLAGRFPETVLALDDNDRTPLHYAATLDDNGHYYNLLVHLGADPRAEDKFGNAPDYYRTNQEELSHRSLLHEFGAEEAVADIINDKDID